MSGVSGDALVVSETMISANTLQGITEEINDEPLCAGRGIGVVGTEAMPHERSKGLDLAKCFEPMPKRPWRMCKFGVNVA